jgi:GTP-binding protein
MTSSVVIIGRPNVGKSTLFNRLIGRRKSIVTSIAGTTRDRIYGEAEWRGKYFTVVDTGGWMLDTSADSIGSLINTQIEKALSEASIILFLCDGKQGLLPLDIEIAKKIRKFNKTVFLCINKVDNKDKKYQIEPDFYELGFENILTISAEHSIGVDDLLDKIIQYLPEKNPIDINEAIKVAIIGKPNVGKSSIINAIIGEERLIISEIPGTTRDTVDINFVYNDKNYFFIDTAGIKKKSKAHDLPELISIIKAKKSIDNADIVLLILDCSREIQHIEAELAGYAYKKIKPIGLVINKSDLLQNKIKDQKAYIKEMREKLDFVSFAPFLFVSAKTNSNIKYILNLIENLYNSYTKRISTSELNEFINKELKDYTLGYFKKLPVKIKYVTQASIKPPTFVFFSNRKVKTEPNKVKYLENLIRKRYHFITVPIKVIIKFKKK